jgi:hypothetical protein
MITTLCSPICGPNGNRLIGLVNRNRSGTYTLATNFSMGFLNIFRENQANLMMHEP